MRRRTTSSTRADTLSPYTTLFRSTRLVDGLAARLMQHGTPVHRGYCETYLGGSALQPFHQIVRSILLHDHHVDPAAGGATLADALERLVPGHGATLTRWFGAAGPDAPPVPFEIGRASCRERGCQYV